MRVETSLNKSIDRQVVDNYIKSLVNRFFKILPMRENNEASLEAYMRSLQLEMIGFEGFIKEIKYDASFITLLSILQYLIEQPNCELSDVRREVFRSINICNKLGERYSDKGVAK